MKRVELYSVYLLEKLVTGIPVAKFQNFSTVEHEYCSTVVASIHSADESIDHVWEVGSIASSTQPGARLFNNLMKSNVASLAHAPEKVSPP
jgi:hypothetical protein